MRGYQLLQVQAARFGQRALCVQHFQVTELAQRKTLGCDLIGRLRTGQHLVAQLLSLGAAGLQQFIVLQQLRLHLLACCGQLVLGLVCQTQRLQLVATIAVQNRQRHGHAHQQLVAPHLLCTLDAYADRGIRQSFGTLQFSA